MALLDASIYQNAPKSILREGLMGYERAMQANAARQDQRGLMAQQDRQAKTFQQQQEEYQRTQKFQQTFRGLAQVNGSTPEGMQKTVQDLDRLGFGMEAMELAQKIPKPVQKTYQSVETDQGLVPFDAQTGTYGSPAQSNGKPLMKQFKPEATKEWDPLGPKRLAEDERHNRAMEANTGKEKPLTAANTVGILERVARRMDDDPALKIVERRDNFFQTAKTAYDQYAQAPNETKAEARRQADQQLLFSLAKMRDEGVVMPGEFIRETQGQGWLTGSLNKIASGVTSGLNLDDGQRKYILDLMGKFRSDAVKRAKPRYEFYRKQGEKYGDAEMVSGAWDPYFSEQAAPPPAAAKVAPAATQPKAGTIEDGYRFKGGDPADPKNWEKQ